MRHFKTTLLCSITPYLYHTDKLLHAHSYPCSLSLLSPVSLVLYISWIRSCSNDLIRFAVMNITLSQIQGIFVSYTFLPRDSIIQELRVRADRILNKGLMLSQKRVLYFIISQRSFLGYLVSHTIIGPVQIEMQVLSVANNAVNVM